MDWIRHGDNDARARQARSLVSVILTSAGAVVLATGCVACSQATGGASPNIVPPSVGSIQAAGASSSGVTSSAAGSNGSGCSTQGIGGDSVAPVCVTPSTPPARGVQGFPTETAAFTTQGQRNQQSASQAAGPPQVTGIFPASGDAAGGDSVTITGTGFTGATGVEFGSVSAQMTVDSDTEIIAVSPPGSGTVNVTVVTPNGTSATGPADQFTYPG
jgi:IPT/TIG domain